MAYDPVRHVAVLVGGHSQGQTFADKFFYEWDGANWTKTTVQLPAARNGASMVFDAGRGKLVLVGGEDSTGATNDAFTYDGALVALPSLDATRVAGNGGATAAYDVTNLRVLVVTGAGLVSSTGSDEVVALGDSASTWTTVCSSCGAYRTFPSIAFDPVLHRMILVGGNDMTGTLADGTWALGSSGYTKVDTNPPGREWPAITYDASRDTIVVFGGAGTNAACPGNCNCADTWEMVPN